MMMGPRGRGGAMFGGSRGPVGGFMNGPPMPVGGGGVSGGFTPTIVHSAFDMTFCEQAFPRVTDEPDETDLANLLIRKNNDLSPTEKESNLLEALMKKTANVFEKLVSDPKLLEGIELDEVQNVGAYRKGTMMKGQNVADIVVIFKSLPLKEHVATLASKVFELVKEEKPKENITNTVSSAGFMLNAPKNAAVVRVLVATLPSNIKNLDSEKHVDGKMIVGHLAAVRHAMWFEEQASNDTVRAMVRIFTNLKHRFKGLSPMTAWMIDLLAHHCVLNVPEKDVELGAVPDGEIKVENDAEVKSEIKTESSSTTTKSTKPQPDKKLLCVSFRRAFQLLAAGIFLPGSVGIIDPCEPNNARCHTALTNENQDMICYTSQTLLRVLVHGGFKQILGYAGNASIATEMSSWNGVVVTASEPGYDPPDDDEEEEEESDENMDKK